MTHRLFAATASSSLRQPFAQTSLLLSNRLEHYVAPASSEPGQMVPVLRYQLGEVRSEFLLWDDSCRDYRGHRGFENGYMRNIARRCVVPVSKITYPRGCAHQGMAAGSFDADTANPLWLAGRIYPGGNDVDRVSLLTAPVDEKHPSTSEHEPVLINPIDLPAWFNIEIDPELLLRSPSVFARARPLVRTW